MSFFSHTEDIEYIVTGGAGFIGSQIVQALNKNKNDKILIVDRLDETKKWQNLRDIQYRDYADKDDFLNTVQSESNLFPNLKAIFHMGACSSTTERNADFLMKNNFLYTKILCQWSLHRSIRFIYASSAATYGNGNQGYDDRASIESLDPLNMYGYSKQIFDLWALKTGADQKIVGLKFFNVYGSGEDHKDDMSSLVFKAFFQVRETGKVRLFKSHHPDYGHGMQLRDFVYIKDVVNMCLFLEKNSQCNGLFNAGCGKARSFKDLVLATFKTLNKAPNIEYIDMPLAIRGQYQYFTEAKMSKLQEQGYRDAFHSIEDGVADYVKHLQNKYQNSISPQ